MTREELEKELASRYWQRVVALYFPPGAGYKQNTLEEPPEEVASRIRLLVQDLYELGIIVDVVDRDNVEAPGHPTGTRAAMPYTEHGGLPRRPDARRSY